MTVQSDTYGHNFDSEIYSQREKVGRCLPIFDRNHFDDYIT